MTITMCPGDLYITVGHCSINIFILQCNISTCSNRIYYKVRAEGGGAHFFSFVSIGVTRGGHNSVSSVPCLVFPPLYHVWCSLHCTMFGVPSIVPCLVFPPLYHVWCSLHCTMFGVPSIVPCLVFPPLYHVWCSLHCTMFGVPSIVPCLVFPPLYHVWCSLHCTMFGVPSIVPCLVFPPLYVPSIVPCLVFPPLYHVWCSLHCTMLGVPSIVRSLHCTMFGGKGWTYMYYSLNELVVLFPISNYGCNDGLFIFCRAIVLYKRWKKNSEYHILCSAVHVVYCARL